MAMTFLQRQSCASRPAQPLQGIGRRARSLRLRDLGCSENGSSLISFAASGSVLCSLIFCFMEICLGFYTHAMISEAAREGTRYAMVRGAACPNVTTHSCEVTAAQVNTFVSGLKWPNLGGGTLTPVTTYPNGNESVGSTVQVRITYSFPISMPFVPSSSISMSATSVATIIQ